MAKLQLKKIHKRYSDHAPATINSADLTIDDGEFVVFVGPSGCGKSTMLRMIAGLESITDGELLIDEQVVNPLSPSERGIGMVFQSYALYPHMTVRENIAFGVKYTRRWDKAKTRQAVEDVAAALELTHLLEHKPGQMSGGQRQRVAIGRALIREPKVFLLDEPLSNLDAALRVRMRMQIADFHKRFNSTTIYVTHDQVEAMTLADKVVVLNKGDIEQVGSPMELYHYPQSAFVATFIGSPTMNMLPVTFKGQVDGMAAVALAGQQLLTAVDAAGLVPGQSLTLGIRPEDVRMGGEGDLSFTVGAKELLGAESILYGNVKGIEAEVLARCPGTLDVKKGQRIGIDIPPTACHLFVENGQALPRLVKPEALFTPPQEVSA